MNDTTNKTADQSEISADVVRPVGYTPKTGTARRRIRLTGGQLILLVLSIPVVVALWFLFAARSVVLEFTPDVEQVTVSGGLSFELGGVYLLTEGAYSVQAQAAGFQPLDAPLSVGAGRSQTHSFTLIKLPGRVSFSSVPDGATVSVDGEVLGTTPTEPIKVAAGSVAVVFSRKRYQQLSMTVDIEGLDRPQSISGELLPDWAEVSLSTLPAGAEIYIDDVSTGLSTPAVVEVLSGEREIRLKVPGYRSHRQRILAAALEPMTLELVQLVKADSLLTITSTPAGAGVTLNGQFHGETPVEIAVKSATRYRLQLLKAGFAPAERSLTLQTGEERKLSLRLRQLTGTLVVQTQPDEAKLYIDGRFVGVGSQTLTLTTVTHQVEIKLDGYASYETKLTPRNGLTQELKIRLLTVQEARIAALKPTIEISQGHKLVLVTPSKFTMGASRRQPGRRANETLREVNMERLFYLARHEVTNAQFNAFASGHDAGEFEGQRLNKAEQPVVNISWEEAALYCNWLSKQELRPNFYLTEFGKVIGINPTATGYRLPTEAEWEWGIRQVKSVEDALRFPWGNNLPPPDRHGNYADHSAAHLVGRIIFGYNDNHIVAAPVGTFTANALGVYDLSGNVSEWVNDYYEIPGEEPTSDPLGPQSAEYRVIRGSSWMNGTVTDLRVSFRDYGLDGRQDVGFRIARFAEAS
ncbi:MAG: PEGA domain-containing protein [Gammaproteobacteria bacterium]|nr:MAG: PEGA domain-containing protein [Gammaproteobacteria bacterium]